MSDVCVLFDFSISQNTDASPAHTVKNNRVARIAAGSVALPDSILAVPQGLKDEMGLALVNNEYRNHGYYLPIPIADFYAILGSAEMDQLKTSCANVASSMKVASPSTQTGKFNKITVKNRLTATFIDCTADARITIKKSVNPSSKAKNAQRLSITFS